MGKWGNGVWGSHGHAGYLFAEYDVCGAAVLHLVRLVFLRAFAKNTSYTREGAGKCHYLNDGSIEN